MLVATAPLASQPAANPFATVVESYTKAAAAWTPGQTYEPVKDLLKIANTDMAKGVELLKAHNAPADLLEQVGTGLTVSQYLKSATGLLTIAGAKIDTPFADHPFSVLVDSATKAAQAGADFLSKLAGSDAA